jgi:hypothetical protein
LARAHASGIGSAARAIGPVRHRLVSWCWVPAGPIALAAGWVSVRVPAKPMDDGGTRAPRSLSPLDSGRRQPGHLGLGRMAG